MFVRTERLFLRPAWPEDADDLLGALEHYDVQPDIAVEPLPRTKRELQRFIEQPRDPRLPHFFMYLRATDNAELVGGIAFGHHEDGAEMGYWVHPNYRGQGFATEAMRAVLKHARSLGHRRIYAKYYPQGAASTCILERLGFREVEEASRQSIPGQRGDEPVRLYVVELEPRMSSRIEATVEVIDT